MIGVQGIVRDIAQRKRAEEALRKRTDEQDVLLSSIPAFVYFKDTESKLVTANKAFAGMVNTPVDQLPGKDAYDLFPKEQAEKFHIDDKKVMASGKPMMNIEERFTDAEGKTRWASSSKVPYFDQKGKVAGMVGITIDITERKQAEEASIESEEKLRFVLENVPDFIITVNRNHEILMINRGVPDVTVEQAMGTNLYNYVEPAHHEIMRESLEKVFQTGMPDKYEVLGMGPKGPNTAWYETRVSANRIDDKVVSVTLISSDITERKRAEQALRESEEFSSGLLANSRNPIVGINPDTSISYVNPALEELTGFSSAELIGRKAPYPWWTEEVFEEAGEVLSGAMLKGAQSVELLFQKKNGERFWVDIRSTPVMRDGQFRYYLSNWVDVTERKRVEEALKESEEFSSSLLNSSPNAIVVINPDTSIRYVNPTFEELTGFLSMELTGRKAPYPWWTEETLHRTGEALKKHMGEGARRVEDLFQKKDGERFWAEISSTPVMRNGQFRYYLSNWVDITERKRAEEALKESEERYRSLFENSIEGVFTVDLDGNFTSYNKAGGELYGYTTEELIGANYKNLLAPENAEFVFEEYNKLFRTGEPIGNLLYEVITKNGERRLAEGYVNVIREKNRIVGFQGTIRDITERKQAEEKLRASEERYRLLFECSPDAIAQMDREGRFLTANPVMADRFGVSMNALIGKRLSEVAPEAIAQQRLDFIRKALDEGQIQIFEDERGGKCLYNMIVPIRVPEQEETVQIISDDITERKRAEERIKASLEEKEVLLQEIHHRVKNNLQIMSSLLKLQSRDIKDERYAEMLNESQNRIKAMSLIHEKLYQAEDLARIDFGGYIKSLVRSLFSAYRAEAGRVTLRTEVEDIRLGVNCAMPCGLIINELVSNSLKHAFPKGKKGEIKVAMRPIGENEAELVVSDNGIGTPESLDLGNPESLGLRLVTILAQQLGARIELDTTEGTKFQIRFGVE